MRRGLKWTGIGCGGVIGVLVLFSIVGALLGRGSPPQATAVPIVIAVQPTIVAETSAPAAPPTPAPAKPTEPPPPPTEVQPAPTTAPVAEKLVITGAGPDGVNMRSEPSATGSRVKLLKDGAAVEVAGEDRQADGRTWRNVKDTSDGATGWVAAEFVASASSAPAPPAASEKPSAPVAATQPPVAKPVAPAPAAKPKTGRAAPQGRDCPPGFPIKGNQGSRSTETWIYHPPGSNSYGATIPEECFATAADAQAAGYRAPAR